MALSKLILLCFLALTATVRAEITDMYFNPIMPFGPYKGQPLERKKDRPVIHLQGSRLTENSFRGEINDPSDPSKSRILVANIFHKGHFYVADIDLDKVKNVYFLFEKFMPLAAHAMVRFEMLDKAPIQLIARVATQEEWAAGTKYIPLAEPMKINDLIMSFDSEWTVGNAGFNPIKGLMKNYTSIFRFLSVDSFIDSYFTSRPFPIEQFRTNLSPGEASDYFRNLLDRSAVYGLTKGFHTVCNNCTNNTVIALKEAVPAKERDDVKRPGFIRRNMDKLLFGLAEVHPMFVPSVLRLRGWRDADSQAPNLEADPKLAPLFEAAFTKSLVAMTAVENGSKKQMRLKQNLATYKPKSCVMLYHY